MESRITRRARTLGLVDVRRLEQSALDDAGIARTLTDAIAEAELALPHRLVTDIAAEAARSFPLTRASWPGAATAIYAAHLATAAYAKVDPGTLEELVTRWATVTGDKPLLPTLQKLAMRRMSARIKELVA